ncbi:MAG: hypothetical protein JWM28_844 [Chitinophagaceae bacterium]|nr:hypothetical protein [Chitinophagaceae bacterium]
MELQNAIFYTTDSINSPTAYRFKINKIKIELHSLWQLVFNGKLDIESLTLINPDVEAIRLKPVKNADQGEISISQEMGRIYNSIHDALEFLDAKRFLIEEGKFSVINKIEAGKLPITISHIHFLVDNTENDSLGNNISEHPNPDNMILRTHTQDISLPDGKHRLSFRNLRINIRKQSIEMDSCTISAEKTEGGHTAFRFFFDTLHLSSVDFGALYKYDIIKADSVYCTKPQIQLVLELKDKNNIKTPLPSLKKIIQPLTGDLQLGYVGIKNADINIETNRNDHSTTFTSQNDNIEITGLHINSDSTDPLVVKSFAMAIRDYETLSRDSTLAYRFDSVKFNNSKVVLSNFTVKTLAGKIPPDVERSYSIPMLELNNLSWDELLFNRNIKASKAVLYYPVVNYKRIKPRKQNQRLKLFRDLGHIDAVTELQQLQVINGQLNMEFDQRTRITLQGADLIVSSNELLGSRNIKSIQRSLTQLQFDKGLLLINDLRAELHNVHFTGKEEQLLAEDVTVYDPTKTLSATAKDVVINELYYTDSTKSISVDGLAWQQATVNLGVFPKQSKPSKSSITIKNISGNNTSLTIQNPLQTISTTIRTLAADELRKPGNEKTTISGLHAVGDNFNLVQHSLWIETGSYDIHDKKSAVFSNACIQEDGVTSSFTGIVAGIRFVPDVAEIMKGHYHLEKVSVNEPLIHLKINR